MAWMSTIIFLPHQFTSVVADKKFLSQTYNGPQRDLLNTRVCILLSSFSAAGSSLILISPKPAFVKMSSPTFFAWKVRKI